MARELGPDEAIPFGIAMDILARVDEIEALCKSVRRDTLRLEIAHARDHERSAAGFRGHTKSAPRFPEPDPIAIAAASHGCAIPEDIAERIDACGE